MLSIEFIIALPFAALGLYYLLNHLFGVYKKEKQEILLDKQKILTLQEAILKFEKQSLAFSADPAKAITFIDNLIAENLESFFTLNVKERIKEGSLAIPIIKDSEMNTMLVSMVEDILARLSSNYKTVLLLYFKDLNALQNYIVEKSYPKILTMCRATNKINIDRKRKKLELSEKIKVMSDENRSK